MISVVLADLAVPRPWRERAAARLVTSVALIVIGSLLTALAARVTIPLPFTPVPITGQVWVLGGAPNRVLHPQNILDSVRSCT